MAGRRFVVGFHPGEITRSLHCLEPGRSLSVGRTTADIRVTEQHNPRSEFVSGNHGTFRESRGAVQFTDHSTNGSRILGQDGKDLHHNTEPHVLRDNETISIQGSIFQSVDPSAVSESLLEWVGLKAPEEPKARTDFYDKLFHAFSVYAQSGPNPLQRAAEKIHPIDGVNYTSSETTPEAALLNSFIKGKYYRSVQNGIEQGIKGIYKQFDEMREQRNKVNSWRKDVPFRAPITSIQAKVVESEEELLKNSREHADLHEGQANRMLESHTDIDFDLAMQHMLKISELMKKTP